MDHFEKEQLLNESMTEHGDYIKRLIFSYVKDSSKAEDIVQEVFIKFYKNLDRFEGRSSIKTFLYRIAVNESQNYLSSWHYRKFRITEKIKNLEYKGSIEDDYIQQEQNVGLGDLIGTMSVKYREVIWLHYYAELTVPEIADVLNCSANTVKTRLLRGRKALKIAIEEKGGTYGYQK